MFNIFGFYKFKKLNNLKKLKNRLENNLKDYEIRGTIKAPIKAFIIARTNEEMRTKQIF